MFTFVLYYLRYVYTCTVTCADPESSVGGAGSNLFSFTFFTFFKTFFSFMRGERIQIPEKAGHHRPASETKWRFAGGPMMAQR